MGFLNITSSSTSPYNTLPEIVTDAIPEELASSATNSVNSPGSPKDPTALEIYCSRPPSSLPPFQELYESATLLPRSRLLLDPDLLGHPVTPLPGFEELRGSLKQTTPPELARRAEKRPSPDLSSSSSNAPVTASSSTPPSPKRARPCLEHKKPLSDDLNPSPKFTNQFIRRIHNLREFFGSQNPIFHSSAPLPFVQIVSSHSKSLMVQSSAPLPLVQIVSLHSKSLMVQSSTDLYSKFHSLFIAKTTTSINTATVARYWNQAPFFKGRYSYSKLKDLLSVSFDIPFEILNHAIVEDSVSNKNTQKTAKLIHLFFDHLVNLCFDETSKGILDTISGTSRAPFPVKKLPPEATANLTTEDHSSPEAYIEFAVQLALEEFNKIWLQE